MMVIEILETVNEGRVFMPTELSKLGHIPIDVIKTVRKHQPSEYRRPLFRRHRFVHETIDRWTQPLNGCAFQGTL